MDIVQVLEEIKSKADKGLLIAIKTMKNKQGINKETMSEIYSKSVEMSNMVINTLEKEGHSDEEVVAITSSLLRLLADTIEIYINDNGIEFVEGEDEKNDAPESMYL